MVVIRGCDEGKDAAARKAEEQKNNVLCKPCRI